MTVLRVKVRPGARVSELTQSIDGTWLAKVKAPPVDGKANVALIELISERFGVRRSQVTIKSGAGARLKLVHINA